jgi:hypothetical protein
MFSDSSVEYCVDGADSSNFFSGKEYVIQTIKKSGSVMTGNVIGIGNAPGKFCFRSDGITFTPPTTIFIRDLGDDEFVLLVELPIQVEQAGEQFAAYSYDLDELAIGQDKFNAIDEMKLAIADLYRILKEEKDNLGPIPQRHWKFLSRVIKEAN